MSIYDDLRADDPGGDLQSAFEALAAMTHTVPLAENTVNVRTVASRYGLLEAEAIRQVVEANYPAWVLKDFEGEGLNVCDPATQAALTVPPFTQPQVDKLISFTTETRLKYHGLKVTHLDKARAQA